MNWFDILIIVLIAAAIIAAAAIVIYNKVKGKGGDCGDCPYCSGCHGCSDGKGCSMRGKTPDKLQGPEGKAGNMLDASQNAATGAAGGDSSEATPGAVSPDVQDRP